MKIEIGRSPAAVRSWPLLVLLALSALGPLALFGWAAWTERVRVLERAEHSAVRTVTALHEHVARVLETHELVLNEVIRLVAERSWDDIGRDGKMWQRLVRIVRDLDQVDAITLVDETGRVRVTTETFPAPDGASVAERPYFRAQIAPATGLYIGAVHTDASGERRVSLSRRLNGPDGAFAGVVQLAVPVSHFEAFWQRFAPSVAHVIPLVRSDGQVIARFPASNTPERLSVTGPFLSRALMQRDGVYTATSLVDGVERLNAFARIRDYPLHISFSVETRAILATWRERALQLGVFSVLAAVALLGLTAMAMQQHHEQEASAESWRAAADRLAGEMAAREQAEAALRRAETLDALGQLTAGVAHDFNNLLQTLTSGLSLLGEEVPENARPILAASLQAVDRGATLVRQLMVFARRERLDPRPTSLHPLIAGMSDLLQKAAGEGVRIEAELERNLDLVLVDPTQAELAILNLVLNARDAMPRGGTVTIAARNVAVPQGESCSRVAAGEYVLLSISDTGLGMTPEVLARATEPFFTTKPVGKGTGLGLSMVHGFVTQSGGSIHIESAPGEGTIVELYLPKALAPTEKGVDAASAAGLKGGSATILLVDDDALARMTTAAGLRKAGYDVYEARDGEEALKVVEQQSSLELIVTDYAMPGMNGAALAERVRRARPDLPAIMITGYAAGTLAQPPAGVTAVLRKPFPLEDLGSAIRDALLLTSTRG